MSFAAIKEIVSHLKFTHLICLINPTIHEITNHKSFNNIPLSTKHVQQKDANKILPRRPLDDALCQIGVSGFYFYYFCTEIPA